jgi:hypothetical protein
MRWAEHATCMGEKRNACRFLVGMPEGKTSLGMLRRRREDNIQMDLREIGRKYMDWIHLAFGNTVLNSLCKETNGRIRLLNYFGLSLSHYTVCISCGCSWHDTRMRIAHRAAKSGLFL